MEAYGGKLTSGFSKYPSKRDNFLDKTALRWLEGKRNDDGAWPYWRIHHKLYDLTKFMEEHPGGSFWIKCTRGLDITELFESFHVGESAEQIVSKYYVGEATSQRLSPFTFHENGFYMTLKRRVALILKNSGEGDTWKYRLIQDTLFSIFIISLCFGGHFESQFSVVLSGIFLAFSILASHNYFHQRDNWRMYIFDFGLFGSRDWRITHAISHHSFPNTIYDFEVSFAEPFIQLIPLQSKSPFIRYFILFGFPIVLAGTAVIWISRIIRLIGGKEYIEWPQCIVGLQMVLLMGLTESYYTGFTLWILLHFTSGMVFSLIGFVSAHWNTETYFEEDSPPLSKDWGIHQIAATKDISGVSDSLLLTAITFGNHTLHHLFPTVDHAKLPLLVPVFMDTCKEFGIEFDTSSWYYHSLGTFKQAARIESRSAPPESCKNVKRKSS